MLNIDVLLNKRTPLPTDVNTLNEWKSSIEYYIGQWLYAAKKPALQQRLSEVNTALQQTAPVTPTPTPVAPAPAATSPEIDALLNLEINPRTPDLESVIQQLDAAYKTETDASIGRRILAQLNMAKAALGGQEPQNVPEDRSEFVPAPRGLDPDNSTGFSFRQGGDEYTLADVETTNDINKLTEIIASTNTDLAKARDDYYDWGASLLGTIFGDGPAQKALAGALSAVNKAPYEYTPVDPTIVKQPFTDRLFGARMTEEQLLTWVTEYNYMLSVVSAAQKKRATLRTQAAEAQTRKTQIARDFRDNPDAAALLTTDPTKGSVDDIVETIVKLAQAWELATSGQQRSMLNDKVGRILAALPDTKQPQEVTEIADKLRARLTVNAN
jgi:hypothetical protein